MLVNILCLQHLQVNAEHRAFSLRQLSFFCIRMFQVDKVFPEQQGPEVGQVRPGQLVNQADVRSAKLLDAQVKHLVIQLCVSPPC